MLLFSSLCNGFQNAERDVVLLFKLVFRVGKYMSRSQSVLRNDDVAATVTSVPKGMFSPRTGRMQYCIEDGEKQCISVAAMFFRRARLTLEEDFISVVIGQNEY